MSVQPIARSCRARSCAATLPRYPMATMILGGCDNEMGVGRMGWKLGAAVGLGVGYYLGTKASNERAAQVERFVQRARSSDITDAAVDKAKAVVELGIERARDAISPN
jgi:uncharacterized protein HemX